MRDNTYLPKFSDWNDALRYAKDAIWTLGNREMGIDPNQFVLSSIKETVTATLTNYKEYSTMRIKVELKNITGDIFHTFFSAPCVREGKMCEVYETENGHTVRDENDRRIPVHFPNSPEEYREEVDRLIGEIKTYI